jgi:hypothetical protein
MFKFTIKLKKGQVIGLGFSEGNLQMLKAAKPIRFLYNDIGLNWPGGVVVAYPTETIERLQLPQEWSLIKLNDLAMKHLRGGRVITFAFTADMVRGSPGGEIMMFWGESEAAIKEQMAGLIGPETEDRSPAVDAGQHRHKSLKEFP